ncbi:MAG: hypothetical protein R6U99_13685 [Nioella sp.]
MTTIFLSAEITRRDERPLANIMERAVPALAASPFTMEIEAEDQDQLFEAIVRFSHSLGDPFRVAEIRLAEDAVCAELDVNPRPTDPRRLH